MSGRATVAAYTINRQPWIPGFEPPYIVAMVGLAEEPDVRLITNVVGIPLDDVRIGLEVEVFFEDWTAMSGEEDTRVWLPLFRRSGRRRRQSAKNGAAGVLDWQLVRRGLWSHDVSYALIAALKPAAAQAIFMPTSRMSVVPAQ